LEGRNLKEKGNKEGSVDIKKERGRFGVIEARGRTNESRKRATMLKRKKVI